MVVYAFDFVRCKVAFHVTRVCRLRVRVAFVICFVRLRLYVCFAINCMRLPLYVARLWFISHVCLDCALLSCCLFVCACMLRFALIVVWVCLCLLQGLRFILHVCKLHVWFAFVFSVFVFMLVCLLFVWLCMRLLLCLLHVCASCLNCV